MLNGTNMKRIIIFLLLSTTLFAQIKFEKYFLDKSMRLDFYHTGDHENEIISFDELIEEPFWAGSKVNLIDIFGYGNYMFEIYDKETNLLIYSRGFSTLFQEWQTTSESKITKRSMSGSLVFPYPQNNVIVKIFRRNWDGEFELKFEYEADPKSYFIKKERRHKSDSFKIHYSGNHNNKVDIVFLPEGYSKEEMSKFKEDCNLYASYLFEYSPFGEYKDKINIWGIDAPSLQSGADIPADSIWKNTLLNSSYYTFDSERYLMTFDYKTVRDVAANAPCDQIYILVNSGKYGGGAIYNYYSLGVTGNSSSKKVFVHEFGHGFAGLADEYVDPSTYEEYYNLNVEPWEANITTLVDFDNKWKDLVDANTPIPTPTTDEYNKSIGAFEGGGYVAKGVYRPTQESLMRAFNSNEFNEVSKRAIEQLIKFYSE